MTISEFDMFNEFGGTSMVQRKRRRPSMSSTDPVCTVGANSKFEQAGPAHDGVGVEITEAVIPRMRRRRGQFTVWQAGGVVGPHQPRLDVEFDFSVR